MDPFTIAIGVLILIGLIGWPMKGDNVGHVADSFVEETSPDGGCGGCAGIVIGAALSIPLFMLNPILGAGVIIGLFLLMDSGPKQKGD
jgi:hypothetical protein